MKILKFRMWNGVNMEMVDTLELYQNGVHFINNSHNLNGEVSLMQFTGLTDRNGVDIYFGDIVEYETTEGTRHKDEVNYSDELCCVMIGLMPYPQLYQSAFIQPSKVVFEIIGNIYQS